MNSLKLIAIVCLLTIGLSPIMATPAKVGAHEPQRMCWILFLCYSKH